MKLRIRNKKGVDEFLDVSLWSFVKCHLLSSLVILGLFYLAIFILICLAILFGMVLNVAAEPVVQACTAYGCV